MNKNLPIFQGVAKPSSDFPAIRSELRAPPNYFELDLGVARSLAAGTAERVTRGGNVLYVDQKANAGYAVVHVQDDFSVGNTPITVFPGFLAKVPFTELLIENDAQPGQVMRFIYGTDIDFEPIPGGGVSVLNAINVADVINPACQYIAGGGPSAVGFTVFPLLLPAVNVRGVVVRQADLTLQAGAGGFCSGFIFGAASAPVGPGSASNQICLVAGSNTTTTTIREQISPLSRSLPASWGVYLCANVDVAAGNVGGNVSLEVL